MSSLKSKVIIYRIYRWIRMLVYQADDTVFIILDLQKIVQEWKVNTRWLIS